MLFQATESRIIKIAFLLEQVDIGLTAENGRRRYEFMFDIKTPKRIYFLAVDSHEEMTTWVQMVCSACGLTSTKDDENGG